MKKVIGILAVIAVAALAVFGYLVWSARSAASEAVTAYNAAVREYNEKIEPYNEAAEGIAAANKQLQDVLDKAGKAVAQGKEAYEPDTLETLQEEMEKAEKALVEIPARIDPFAESEMPDSLNRAELEAEKLEAEAAEAAVREAMSKIPALPAVPDYAERITDVQKAEKAYEDSVRRLVNVTAPADAFVRERVRGLESVVQTAAVSEKNDPNGLLGKKGGYLGCIYFLDERVDRSMLPAEVMPEEDIGAESNTDPDSGSGAGAGEGDTAVDADSAKETEASAEAGAAGTSAEAPADSATAPADSATTPADATTMSAVSATASAAASTTEETAAADSEGSTPEEEEERLHVIAAGTDGGGAVEIYATAEEAEARDEYLAFFSGSVMDPGAHAVEGTCVIRASKYLEVDQQQALIEAVRAALLKVE